MKSQLSVVGGRTTRITLWFFATYTQSCSSLRESIFLPRSVVKLTGYDAEKQEINRPSELLNNVKVCGFLSFSVKMLLSLLGVNHPYLQVRTNFIRTQFS